MIVDTHTHFYDPYRPQGVPWPDPNDTVLYRTVLPHHYRALAVPEGVTGTIVVEASPWVEDNEWILGLAANDPFLLGLVGSLDPASADFARHLDRFAANPLFLGIRVGVWSRQGMEGASFLQGIEALAARELALDVLLGPEGLPAVAGLAARFPNLRIVLDHVAGVRVTGGAPDAHWVEGIRLAARNPLVFCKVSGMPEQTGMQPAPTDLSFYTPVLDVLWHAFGEDRLVYGSNWPVCERFASYGDVQRLATSYFRARGDAALSKYTYGNSVHAYRWKPRDLPAR